MAAPTRSIFHGELIDGSQILDEVLVSVLDHSDHEVEVLCHAGFQSVNRILEALERRGVPCVDYRVYLYHKVARGQIDAIGAEALELLPQARSHLAVTILLSQLHGALSNFVETIRTGKTGPGPVAELLRPPRLGEAACVPRKVVILGPPNAGKSTLFNALLEMDRAITAPIPGTTRDALAEEILVEGVPLLLVDTAGKRESSDPVESIAAAVADRELQTADVALVVLDASLLPAKDAAQQIQTIKDAVPETCVVLNKIDLGTRGDWPAVVGPVCSKIVQVSALVGTGLGSLRKLIVDTMAPRRDYEPGTPAIFTSRQASLFASLLEHLSSEPAAGEKAIAEYCDRLLHGYPGPHIGTTQSEDEPPEQGLPP